MMLNYDIIGITWENRGLFVLKQSDFPVGYESVGGALNAVKAILFQVVN